jgi:homospermidine synthase
MTQETDRLFVELREKVMAEYAEDFHSRAEIAGGGAKQTVFQAIYLSALIDLAAELAVDINMGKANFMGAAEESFDRQTNNAPRFG